MHNSLIYSKVCLKSRHVAAGGKIIIRGIPLFSFNNRLIVSLMYMYVTKCLDSYWYLVRLW